MDPNVIAAMAKWPNVPAVFGWLGLSARGEWRIKGEPIRNDALRAFIGRNYSSIDGQWFFQNGPQRVFVSLELAPLVYRIDAEQGRPVLTAQTGARPQTLRAAAWTDDGFLLIDTEIGPGNIDDRDSAAALVAICDDAGRTLDDANVQLWLQGGSDAWLNGSALGCASGLVPIERLARERIGQRFGFDPEPCAPGDAGSAQPRASA